VEPLTLNRRIELSSMIEMFNIILVFAEKRHFALRNAGVICNEDYNYLTRDIE